MDLGDEDLRYKQALTWFAFDRKNDADKTLLDEFIEMFVSDPTLASKARRLKDITHDTFTIEREADAEGIIVASAESSGKRYNIMIPRDQDQLLKGRRFDGRIQQSFKDGIHLTAGVLVVYIQDSPFEPSGMMKLASIMKKINEELLQKIESIPIKPSSRAAPLLKHLPIMWINGICDSLNISAKHYKAEKIQAIVHALTTADSLYRIVSELTDAEYAILQFILKKGGIVKTYELDRKFGRDDTGGSWMQKPTSATGKLRRRGLLIVGNMVIKTKTYKVAAIPADVAKTLKPFLW